MLLGMYFFSFFSASSYVCIFFSSFSFRKERIFILSLNSSVLAFPTAPWFHSIRLACVSPLTLSLTLVFSFSPLYYLLLPFSLYVAWFAVLFIQVLFTLNLSALFYSSGLSPPSFCRNFSKKLIFLSLVLPGLIYYQRDISKMQI